MMQRDFFLTSAITFITTIPAVRYAITFKNRRNALPIGTSKLSQSTICNERATIAVNKVPLEQSSPMFIYAITLLHWCYGK